MIYRCARRKVLPLPVDATHHTLDGTRGVNNSHHAPLPPGVTCAPTQAFRPYTCTDLEQRKINHIGAVLRVRDALCNL